MKDCTKKFCEDCGNAMTLLLDKFVCDWCDGLVGKEWSDSSKEVTEPLFFHGIGLHVHPIDESGTD